MVTAQESALVTDFESALDLQGCGGGTAAHDTWADLGLQLTNPPFCWMAPGWSASTWNGNRLHCRRHPRAHSRRPARSRNACRSPVLPSPPPSARRPAEPLPERPRWLPRSRVDQPQQKGAMGGASAPVADHRFGIVGLTFSAVISARVREPAVSPRGKQNSRMALCGSGRRNPWASAQVLSLSDLC